MRDLVKEDRIGQERSLRLTPIGAVTQTKPLRAVVSKIEMLPSLLPMMTGSILLCFLMATGARGQITPDGSLPDNSIVTPSPVTPALAGSGEVTITGGTIRDSYLFHSFEEFSIPTGGAAFFDNPVAIENIVSRVTGQSISEIDGLIRANGGANLFLLNPNGIVIGANASLDIGGSFVGTTANSIEFADGSIFGTSAGEVPGAPPLLTINVPLGLQFGGSTPPGQIRVRGSGNNLIANPQTLETIRDSRPSGFEVNPGQTLALLGGEVTIVGGNITAPGGRIELWSVANGELSVVPELSSAGGSRLKVESQSQSQASQSQAFQSIGAIELGNINLLQAASVDTSGSGGGEIRVRGKRVELRDGSAILADTLGTEAGGSLTVSASESVEIQGTSADGMFSSSLLAVVAPEASGSGGNITIESDSLLLADGAQVAVNSLGSGNAGSLTAKASSVELIGTSALGLSSGLFAGSTAIGAGGNLTVEAGSLRLADGGQVVAATLGFGDAGDLTVRASSVEIVGSAGRIPSGLSSSSGGIGSAGNITIESDRLLVSDGAQVLAAAFGSGNAGSLTVKTGSVEILGTSADGNPTILSTSSVATGAGGNLTVNAESLRIAGGAQVASSTRGSGNAGNLTITAGEIELAGTSPNGLFSSGLFASAVVGSGNGGDTTISANQLIVRDGAIVSASNFPSLNPNIPPGTGAAGNINIEANSIELSNGGTLSADTGGGDRGNITLRSPDVRLRRASQIRTNAQGQATGGNITIDTDNLVAVPKENSDITANAEQSFGGRVIVNAQGIFGTEFREALTPESDITASSELGAEFNGIVELNTPDADPSSGLHELQGKTSTDRLVVQDLCAPERLAANSFTIVGRGGLPPSPVDLLTDETVALEWSRPEAMDSSSYSSATSVASAAGNVTIVQNPVQNPVHNSGSGGFSESNLPLKIREAQGWIVAPDGTVILTAEPRVVTPASPMLALPGCADLDV